MRGDDEQQAGMFSYVSPEQRVPSDHLMEQLSYLLFRRFVGLNMDVVVWDTTTFSKNRTAC